MLPMTGLRMKQRLVMTPELSADTNEGAKMARETIRNRYKLQQTLSDQDEDELDK